MVTPWNLEKIEDFRVWHEQRIQELYVADQKIIQQFRWDREKFLGMVTPRSNHKAKYESKQR